VLGTALGLGINGDCILDLIVSRGWQRRREARPEREEARRTLDTGRGGGSEAMRREGREKRGSEVKEFMGLEGPKKEGENLCCFGRAKTKTPHAQTNTLQTSKQDAQINERLLHGDSRGGGVNGRRRRNAGCCPVLTKFKISKQLTGGCTQSLLGLDVDSKLKRRRKG